jgi:hypothetical protein
VLSVSTSFLSNLNVSMSDQVLASSSILFPAVTAAGSPPLPRGIRVLVHDGHVLCHGVKELAKVLLGHSLREVVHDEKVRVAHLVDDLRDLVAVHVLAHIAFALQLNESSVNSRCESQRYK